MRKPHAMGWLLSAALLTAVAASGAAVAGSFGLQVNDVSGLDEPWPLVGGLPFPEGELSDASQIRVVGADGQEVPAQIDVAATWRDGSVRWALVGLTASPQGEYRVEYGPGVSRSAPETPLRVERDAAGKLTVDTGAAVYEFLPDRLLPETARMGGTVFLSNAGGGAYLVDNHGRLARVSGERAEVETQVVKQGPARTVVRRDGWYVTETGERVARAKAWFYFAAGSPYMRVSHSLVFTEDTNEIWVRDYGLEFRAPEAPERAVFAVGGREQEELLSTEPVEVDERFSAPLDGGEVYMLQDVYPHFLERETRAVVGRSPAGPLPVASAESFWAQEWLREAPAVGDWADGAWAGHGLTVVTPWLAQQFPKEIAFGPQGARVALWSGRSGRELDFRTVTLVNEYWQSWAERAPEGANGLAEVPTNAQCAARTHDVWVLPRRATDSLRAIEARAKAVSRPPLVLADPKWLAASEAIGWPMHPKDEQRFAREEQVLSEFWDALMDHHEQLRRTGFIGYGGPPHIRGAGSQFFRVSALVDYGLRRHVWGLYARSGDRRYVEYATRFNRFAGDWSIAHWTAGDKFAGGFASDSPLGNFWSRPLYWGTRSQLEPVGGNTGHDVVNWMLEHYMTGDEYAMDLIRMHGEAFKEHWEETSRSKARYDGIYMILRVMANLYAVEWDEAFGEMARDLARYVIDMDRPNAISDEIRFGSLYKEDRNLISLYYYARETGDELARAAFLQGMDHMYRFNRVGGAFSGQSYPSFLFSIAYRWTGNPNYLRAVNSAVDEHRRWSGRAAITSQINPTMGVPVALGVLAEAETPIEPFPILRLYREPESTRILFRKAGGRPVTMRFHLRMSNDLDEDASPTALLAPHREEGSAARPPEALPLQAEQLRRTAYTGRSDPRRWHISLTVPAGRQAGLYALRFPGAEYADLLDTDAPEISVYAPDAFRMLGARSTDCFPVGEGVETLRLFVGVPTTVTRPDGTVAVEADRANVGEHAIPVNGQAGAWRLNPTVSGIARLFNAEPLFTRSPQRLVTGADVPPAPRFEPPTEEMAFVPGKTGLALHMPGGTILRFPRGAPTGEGYEHFPGDEGTIEFWFRPNWSAIDLPFNVGSFTDRYFLRAGSHDLQYRRGRARSSYPELASFNLWVHGEDSNTGFTGRCWLEAGEWYHVAFTWRTHDGKPGDEGEFAVYVNGESVTADDFERYERGATIHFWPGRVSRSEIFVRREANEAISVGPVDGTIAQLRISDTIRYESQFEPPETLPEPDARVRVQFPLDGDWVGRTGDGGTVTLEP